MKVPHAVGAIAAIVLCAASAAPALAGTPIALADGFEAYARGYAAPQWSEDAHFIYLSGMVGRTDGAITPRVIGTLPAGARPAGAVILNGARHDQTARIDVSPNGEIKWAAATGDQPYVSLSGLSFPKATTTMTPLSLANGAIPYHATSFSPPSYRVDGDIIHLSGLVEIPVSATTPLTFGNLATGRGFTIAVRPLFAQNAHLGVSGVRVQPNGDLVLQARTSSPRWIPLDGVAITMSAASGVGYTVRGGRLAVHGSVASPAAGATVMQLPTTFSGVELFAVACDGTAGLGTARVDVQRGGAVKVVDVSNCAGGTVFLDGIEVATTLPDTPVSVGGSVPTAPSGPSRKCVGPSDAAICINATWTQSGTSFRASGDLAVETIAGPWTLAAANVTFDPSKPLFVGTAVAPLPSWGWLKALMDAAGASQPRPELVLKIGSGADIGDVPLDNGLSFTKEPDKIYIYAHVSTGGRTTVTQGDLSYVFGQSAGNTVLIDPTAPGFYESGDLGLLTLGMVPSAAMGVFLGTNRPVKTSSRAFRTTFDSDARAKQTLRASAIASLDANIEIPALKIVSIGGKRTVTFDFDKNNDGKSIFDGDPLSDFAMSFEGTLELGLGITGAALDIPLGESAAYFSASPLELAVTGELGDIALVKCPFPFVGETTTAGYTFDGRFRESDWLVELGATSAKLMGVGLYHLTATMSSDGWRLRARLPLNQSDVTVEGVAKSDGSWVVTGSATLSGFGGFAYGAGEVRLASDDPKGARVTGTASVLGAAFDLDGHFKSPTVYALTGTVSSGAPQVAGFPVANAALTLAPGVHTFSGAASVLGQQITVSGSFDSPTQYRVDGAVDRAVGSYGSLHVAASQSAAGGTVAAKGEVSGTLSFAGRSWSFSREVSAATTVAKSASFVINVNADGGALGSVSGKVDAWFEVVGGASFTPKARLRVTGTYSPLVGPNTSVDETVKFGADGSFSASLPLGRTLNGNIKTLRFSIS